MESCFTSWKKNQKTLCGGFYNANRFVVLPEGKEPHEIKLPDYQKLTEAEDFIRKMKRLKMPDETIQHFLNSFQKEK